MSTKRVLRSIFTLYTLLAWRVNILDSRVVVIIHLNVKKIAMKVTILLPILLVFNLFLQSQSWLFIKRRRRSCSPSNCRVSSWSSWSTCSRSCGSGTQGRARVKTVGESCGGSCSYKLQETRVCNTNCCPVNCVYSWGSWSACKGCGKSTQSRSPSIRVRPSCGGRSCPGKQTRSCDTGQ